ncbi:MAG: hypothetical protein JNM86_11150 [Phycisphaerae bacterium]|nr:hypothetical protein [Phycisphaerae bacterium]
MPTLKQFDPDSMAGWVKAVCSIDYTGRVLAGVNDDDCAVIKCGSQTIVVSTDFVNAWPIALELGVGGLEVLGRLPVGPSLATLRQHHLSKLTKDDVDASVRIVCLYALVFSEQPGSSSIPLDKSLLALFDSIWISRGPALSELTEQNIEYIADNKNCYVRVPWQLYLLALAARIRPYKAFGSATAQKQLDSILDSINKHDGFRYPNSGKLLSARTNGILYEVLGHIQQDTKNRSWLAQASGIQWIRATLARSFVRVPLALAATGLVLWAGWGWWHKPERSISEFFPDLAASLIAWLALLGKRE